jgi:DNA primase catalytic core
MDIPKLLNAVDLEDLVTRAGATLHRNGRSAHSACPLHAGADNPNAFTIQRKEGRQLWYCFTRCHDGGDAIDFMRRWKGLDFQTAARELARMYNVDIGDLAPKDAAAEQRRRTRTDVLTLARTYYQAQLHAPGEPNQAALSYLISRGFTPANIEQAGWGYSDGSLGLHDYLAIRYGQVILDTAHDIGLVRRDGRDFCANAEGQAAAPHGYIVFPHRDDSDRVSYYSSRAVEIPDHPRPDPKDKSRNLPGPRQLYRADVEHQYDQVILVEGVADAETLRQWGYSAWALCGLGSKLEPADLAALQRRKAIYLSTDADKAGQTAINTLDGNLVPLANSLGPLTLLLPPLATGKDFNKALSEGTKAEDIAAMQKASATWLEKRIDQARDCATSELDARISEIGKLLSACPEGARSRFYKPLQTRLCLSRKDINELIHKDNSNHVAGSIKDGQICFMGRPLGNFHARITHELMIDDGQNPPIVRYTITGALQTGQPLETVDVPAEEFATLKWVPRYWGARPVLHVSSGSYYEVSRAIQEISGDMKRERVHTYTGWTGEGETRAYLSASGRIHATGLDETTRVDLGHNNLRHYSLPIPPTGNALYDAGRASVDFLKVSSRAVTAPLWAAMYAAPLSQIAPLYTVLWVYGPTQSGKSTVAHLALNHYGIGFAKGRQYNAPIDWTSTVVGLEGAMYKIKDAPLIIDDFAPQNSTVGDSREINKRAQFVVRSVGNRSSKTRGNADLSERITRIPRGLVIATAELPLMGESTVGRMLYIPVTRADVFEPPYADRLDAAQIQAQTGLYAAATSAYIQWLISKWAWVSEQLPQMIEGSVNIIRQACPQLQNRLPDYFCLLNACQSLALRCWQDLDVISGYEAAQELAANKEALKTLVVEQAAKIAAESPVKKFIEAISSLLERSKVYLAPSTTTDVRYDPPLHADLIGWYNPRQPDVVYLSTDVALAAAKEYWRDLDEYLDTLPDALRRQIEQAGLIKERDNRSSQVEVPKWIQGKTRRVLVLDTDRIADLYGCCLANEPGKSQPEPPEPKEVPF